MGWFFWGFLALNILSCIVFYTSALFTKIYPVYFLRRRFPRYSRIYNPTTHLFIPCKGISGGHHIPYFLKLKLPGLKVFFVVESKSDPAFSSIEKQIQGHPDFKLITAGHSHKCGQKNHNLIKGIEASGQTADVYVFLDSDIHLSSRQLRKLVLPLSDPSVTMSSGFQWNLLLTGRLSERLLAFLTGLQHMAMSNPFLNNIWGGASAIRRTDFENMNVKEYWAKTAVDDMSLKRLLRKNNKKAVFVPYCINESHRHAEGLLDTIYWFERQILYLKFYVPTSWLSIVFVILYSTLNYIIFALSAVWMALGKTACLEFLAVSLIYTLLTMGVSGLIKRKSNDNHSMLEWMLLSPVFIVLSTCSVIRSILFNKIVWKNITYKMAKDGLIEEIIRE